MKGDVFRHFLTLLRAWLLVNLASQLTQTIGLIMSDKIKIDLPVTTDQLAKLIQNSEKHEAEEASKGLKFLTEYDLGSSTAESLTTTQAVLVALAYNQPCLLENTFIESGPSAVNFLDPASRDMLYIWFAARERILKDYENSK
jgi:hypothetical protein